MDITLAEFVVLAALNSAASYSISERNHRGEPLESIKSLPDVRFEILYIDCVVVLMKPAFDTRKRYYLKRSLFGDQISAGDKIFLPCDESELVEC